MALFVMAKTGILFHKIRGAALDSMALVIHHDMVTNEPLAIGSYRTPHFATPVPPNSAKDYWILLTFLHEHECRKGSATGQWEQES